MNPKPRPKRIGICFNEYEPFYWDATDEDQRTCPGCPADDDEHEDRIEHRFYVAESAPLPEPRSLRERLDELADRLKKQAELLADASPNSRAGGLRAAASELRAALANPVEQEGKDD